MSREAILLRRRLCIRLLAFVLLFAGAMRAAPISNSVFSPTLGFVFDPRIGSLRPITGIPGAAKVGQPLSLVHGIDNAAISPGQDYALIWRSNSAGLKLVRFDSPVQDPNELTIGETVTRIVFSRSGAAAVILETGGLQVISGLPESPTYGSKIQLQWGGLSPATVAIRDDGSAVLAGFSDGVTGTLALWTNDAGIRFIAASGYPASIAFDSNGKDALVADAASNQVILIKDVAGGASPVVVAGEDQGVGSPQIVAFDNNDELAISLNQDGKILVASLAENWTRSIVPPVHPAGLSRLKGSSAFRLTDDIFRPIWCIAVTKDEDRLFFIPAALPPAKRRPQEWAR